MAKFFQNRIVQGAGSYASVISSPTQHAPLSISRSLARFKLVVASLDTFWSNQPLVFCSTIIASSYSNSYELVTVIAVNGE
ncbi:hypothetical protein ACTXT7_002795 [Hymenolepis weldensis]